MEILAAPNRGEVTVRSLISFCRVADAGSVGQASEDPRIQSAIRRDIQKVIAAYGSDLFLDKDAFSLSPRGQAFVVKAREILGGLRSLEQVQADNTLRFGAGAVSMKYLIIPVAREMSELTGIGSNARRVDLMSMRTSEVIVSLLSGHLDFGIVRTESINSIHLFQGLEIRPLGDFGYAMIVRTEDAETILKYGLPANYPVAILGGSGDFSLEVTRRLRNAGVILNIQYSTTYFHEIVDLVRMGFCAGIVPKIVYQPGAVPSVSEVPFDALAGDGKLLVRSYSLAFCPERIERKSLTSHAEKLVKLLEAKITSVQDSKAPH